MGRFRHIRSITTQYSKKDSRNDCPFFISNKTITIPTDKSTNGEEWLQIADLCVRTTKERTNAYVTAVGARRRAQDAPLYALVHIEHDAFEDKAANCVAVFVGLQQRSLLVVT